MCLAPAIQAALPWVPLQAASPWALEHLFVHPDFVKNVPIFDKMGGDYQSGKGKILLYSAQVRPEKKFTMSFM